MIIEDLLRKKNISMYKLSKLSGVPQSTISDICSKKASIEKCSALTLHKIAKVLDVSVDDILEAEMHQEKSKLTNTLNVDNLG